MTDRRRELIRCLEESGFYLRREGGNHSIYTNGKEVVPVKRQRILDRIIANQLCRQAGLKAKF